MIENFPWYNLEDEEDYNKIWANSIMTVDANVLLDLYRYHPSTRDALLLALEHFSGRIWISNQTAQEFLKNRKKVIADLDIEIDKSLTELNQWKQSTNTSISKLKNLRLLDRSSISEFEAKIANGYELLQKNIDNEKVSVSNYRNSDPIFSRLTTLLKDCVGTEPTDREDAIKEADRRRKEKIPPGYEDKGKEGDGFAGDYLMWRQILSFCKEKKKPMILVTSEQKRDWWEVWHGKTLNPRLELLREAHQETGQRIKIYHTDRFIKYFQENITKAPDESVLDEIRSVQFLREPAVGLTQDTRVSSKLENKGRIYVRLSRQVFNFTGSGGLFPNLSGVPTVDVELISTPPNTPKVRVRANTGTTYDFNIHLRSLERDKPLPIGDYIFDYVASASDSMPTDLINGLDTD